jgi:hypothetical protein
MSRTDYRQITKLMSFPDMGREAWVKFDQDAEVYELFASKEADDYIGCADTLEEARQVAREWAEFWMHN